LSDPAGGPYILLRAAMTFWNSKLGAALCVLLLACVVVVSVAGVGVWRATHPARQGGDAPDFDALRMQVESVRFPAADGVSLAGWWIEGEPGRPPILLCHDVGSSKEVLLPLAIELRRRGYAVLLTDFRGHGESRGRGSTLGLDEKRDVLGALDHLAARHGQEPPRVGVYGAGMGAHAAVLAAADRPALRVLVLDGLYPEVTYPLAREVYAGWKPGIRHLGFLAGGLFAVVTRTRPGEHRAADVVARLRGRDLLLLAPAGDAELTAEIQRMVESIPVQPEVDGSMLVLPATLPDGLYGEHLGHHREQVARYLDDRLTAWALRATLER
jgi:alpha-beta hydrolase superfamily lysophospholipase